ncbi:DUF1269 domain-containing protein [Nocardioides sp. URHA0020]|uniref:DUF1269 domain-containing protein n=1 Tax=Nocardioides sp. URHA0020 TaxID=1380392 RepID=UPI0018CC55A0|nr:DUF1269 domain-containing protein [Nocardioides sp. URHA0020]
MLLPGPTTVTSTLAAWRFASADGASGAAGLLEAIAHDDPVVLGSALVEWAPGDRRPTTRRLALGRARADGRGEGLGDGFWGLLFGIVFFVPLLGAAMGATTGALTDALADVGIDDHFINRVRDSVIPGTSALFVLAPSEVVERLRAASRDRGRAAPITTDIDDEQAAALRSVFG